MDLPFLTSMAHRAHLLLLAALQVEDAVKVEDGMNAVRDHQQRGARALHLPETAVSRKACAAS